MGMTATHLGTEEALNEYTDVSKIKRSSIYHHLFTRRESIDEGMTVPAEPAGQLKVGWLAAEVMKKLLEESMNVVASLYKAREAGNGKPFEKAVAVWQKENGKRNFMRFYCSLASAVVYSLVIEELRAAPKWACLGPPPYRKGLKELSPWQNTLVLTNDYRNLVLGVSLLLEIRGLAADFVRAQRDQIRQLWTSFDRLAREEAAQRGLQLDPTPDPEMRHFVEKLEGLQVVIPNREVSVRGER